MFISKCACKIVQTGWQGDADMHIEYCSLHKAAPELLEALKTAISDWGFEYGLEGDPEAWKKLVAKAESQ